MPAVDSTPQEAAGVGSGIHLGRAPAPDWTAVVQTLIDAGARVEGAYIDRKPPSEEIGALPRRYVSVGGQFQLPARGHVTGSQVAVVDRRE
ncbi:MAG: hypothetical protein HOY79_54610 [Streptomyces sp.]|nr:hypothetical protein [Streptomyces sp.]